MKKELSDAEMRPKMEHFQRIIRWLDVRLVLNWGWSVFFNCWFEKPPKSYIITERVLFFWIWALYGLAG